MSFRGSRASGRMTMFAVVAHQLRRHPSHFAAGRNMDSKNSVCRISSMMAEGDLGRPGASVAV